MEEKIIHRIGLLGEKFGAITMMAASQDVPTHLKTFFVELGKDYERQKDFLEEVLKWHRNNGR